MKPFEWMRAAIADDLTPSQTLLVYALATHTMGVNGGTCCDASYSQLQEWTHLSERAVRYALRALADRGWVSALPTYSGKGRQGANTYVLTHPEPVDNQHDAASQGAPVAPLWGHVLPPFPHKRGAPVAPPLEENLSTRTNGSPVDNSGQVRAVVAALANRKRLP